MNAGYSFLGIVMASGIIGFGIDKVFNTQPWGLLSFLIIGLVYAVIKAQNEMKASSETDAPQERPDKKDPE